MLSIYCATCEPTLNVTIFFLFLQHKLKSLCYVTLGGAVAYQFIYYKKDFSGYYDQYIKPLSHILSPEWAHRVGVAAIKYGVFPPDHNKDPKVLVCTDCTHISHFIMC